MQSNSDYLQNNDDAILFQPVLVPRQAIQSLSVMPVSLPPQPISVQPIQQAESPAPLPHTIPQKQHAQYGEGKTTRKGPATEKQMNTVLSIAKQLNMTEAEVCRLVGAKSYSEMSNAQAHGFIASHNEMQPQF